MSAKDLHHFKPFFSVLLVILTLFIVVFLQMEERRMGYSVLKLNKEYKKVLELRRTREIHFAKLNRPQFLDQMAQTHFTLKRAQSKQIIHLSADTTTSHLQLQPMLAVKGKL